MWRTEKEKKLVCASRSRESGRRRAGRPSILSCSSPPISYLEHSKGDVRLFLGQDALVDGGGGCCCVVCVCNVFVVAVVISRLRAQQSGLVVVVNEEKRKSHCDGVCFYPRVSLDPLLSSPLNCAQRTEKTSEVPERRFLHERPWRIGGKHWSACLLSRSTTHGAKTFNSQSSSLTVQRPLCGSPGFFRGARDGQLLQGRGQVAHCRRRRHVSEHVDGAAAVFCQNGFAGGVAEDGAISSSRAGPLPAASAAPGARGRQGPRRLSRSSDDDIVLFGVVHFVCRSFKERESRRFSLLLVVFYEREARNFFFLCSSTLFSTLDKKRHQRPAAEKEREKQTRASSPLPLLLLLLRARAHVPLEVRARRREVRFFALQRRGGKQAKRLARLPPSIASALLSLLFALSFCVLDSYRCSLSSTLLSSARRDAKALVHRPEKPREQKNSNRGKKFFFPPPTLFCSFLPFLRPRAPKKTAEAKKT